MRVRVERRAALREQRRDPLALRREQLLGTLDQGDIGHPPEPIRSPHGRSHATWSRFAPPAQDQPRRAAARPSSACSSSTTSTPCSASRACTRSRSTAASPPPRSATSRRATSRARRSWPTATRASRGKPGVCALITGAGLTNAATPIAGAYHDSIPMLVVSSATASADNGRGHGTLHDLPDQRAFMSTITAESIDVRDPADLPEAFARAFEIFESRRPRPVHIGIPIDVLDLPAPSWQRLPARGATPVADPALVERAVELLAGAERPMLLLGGGAVAAGAEAAAVAERLGAPVGLTVNAKGVAARQPSAEPRHHAHAAARARRLRATPTSCSPSAPSSPRPTTSTRPAPPPRTSRATLVRIDIDADQLQRQRAAAVGLHGDAARDARRDRRRPGRPRSRAQRAAPSARRLCTSGRWWPGAEVHLPFLAALERGLPDDGDPRRRLDPAGLRRPPLVARPRAARVHRARRLRHARPGAADGDRRAARRAGPARGGAGRRRRRAVHDPGARERRRPRPADRARDLAERRLRRDARLDGPHRRAARGHRDQLARLRASWPRASAAAACARGRSTTCRARWPRPSRPTARRSSRCAADAGAAQGRARRGRTQPRRVLVAARGRRGQRQRLFKVAKGIKATTWHAHALVICDDGVVDATRRAYRRASRSWRRDARSRAAVEHCRRFQADARLRWRLLVIGRRDHRRTAESASCAAGATVRPETGSDRAIAGQTAE